jgi:acyl-coenzyme A thioesterase PaaI-like protein
MTSLSARWLRHLMNLWPPFLASGIHVTHLAHDWSFAKVRLRLHPLNRNYVGTHFGGSLFAMTDPFWMLLVMNQLGKAYTVWDKAGAIEFVSAKREPVFAEFHINPNVIAEIQASADQGEKVLHWFEVPIKTQNGDLVAHVRKQLYIRQKRSA